MLRAAWRAWFGSRGERLAARYLKRRGCRILARGLRSRLGEIDLLVHDGRWLAFVEVKTRDDACAGRAVEAITPAKQRRITRTALGFLKARGLFDRPVRFDVVAVDWPEGGPPTVEHIPHAFEASGNTSMFS